MIEVVTVAAAETGVHIPNTNLPLVGDADRWRGKKAVVVGKVIRGADGILRRVFPAGVEAELEIQWAETQAAFHIFRHAVDVLDKGGAGLLLGGDLRFGLLIETPARREVLRRDQAVFLLASPARTILRLLHRQNRLGRGLSREGEDRHTCKNSRAVFSDVRLGIKSEGVRRHVLDRGVGRL